MPMTAKDRLRKLVDGLDDGQAEDVLALVERRLDSPFARALAASPLDDEPTTPEEDEGARDAWGEYQCDQAITAERAKAELLE